MAKLISLGNNSGNENRTSDEELNQMFGAFMDAFCISPLQRKVLTH